MRMEAVLAMPATREFPVERALALEAAGGIAYWQGDMAYAQVAYDESLALTREHRDEQALANAIYNDAFPAMIVRSDVPRAVAALEEALPIFKRLGDEPGIARCMWALGQCLISLHDYPAALRMLGDAIELFQRLDDRFGLGWAFHTRAVNAVSLGDAATAAPLVREGLEIFVGAGDVSAIVVFLDDAAALAKLEGDMVSALRLAGAAHRHQVATGAALAGLINVNEGREWEEMISTPDEQKAWAEGQAMSIEQAVAEARATLDRRIIAAGER